MCEHDQYCLSILLILDQMVSGFRFPVQTTTEENLSKCWIIGSAELKKPLRLEGQSEVKKSNKEMLILLKLQEFNFYKVYIFWLVADSGETHEWAETIS